MPVSELVVAIAGVVFLGLLALLVNTILRGRQRHLSAQNATIQHQHEALRAQLAVQAQTLEHTRAELLDNIGQLLSVARLNLNLLEEADVKPVYLRQIITSNELVNQALGELRTLSQSLGGDLTQNFSLVQSLKHELQRLQEKAHIRTELHLKGNRQPLGFATEIVLFRMCQELLTPLGQQSDAVGILLRYGPNRFSIRISSTGPTVDWKMGSATSADRSGLENVLRKASLLGGQCLIQPMGGEASSIEIRIPNPGLSGRPQKA